MDILSLIQRVQLSKNVAMAHTIYLPNKEDAIIVLHGIRPIVDYDKYIQERLDAYNRLDEKCKSIVYTILECCDKKSEVLFINEFESPILFI